MTRVRDGMNEADDSRFAGALAVLASQSCPFPDLSSELLQSLLSTMRVREYGPGEHLIRQGAPGDYLFLILSRIAEAFIRQLSSDHTTVGKFGPGDVVGEISLLTDYSHLVEFSSRRDENSKTASEGAGPLAPCPT